MPFVLGGLPDTHCDGWVDVDPPPQTRNSPELVRVPINLWVWNHGMSRWVGCDATPGVSPYQFYRDVNIAVPDRVYLNDRLINAYHGVLAGNQLGYEATLTSRPIAECPKLDPNRKRYIQIARQHFPPGD